MEYSQHIWLQACTTNLKATSKEEKPWKAYKNKTEADLNVIFK